MTTRFRLDPVPSRFTVQAFASGMLSFLGHSPTFVVRDFTGEVVFEGEAITTLRLALTVKAQALELVDDVKPSDRKDIETRMREEVLETATYPEITYRAGVASADRTGPGRHRLHLLGQLSLHGVTRPQPVDAELLVLPDGIRLRGESALRLSDYHIRPVTALGGMIKLKDDLKLAFDLIGVSESPPQA